LAYLKEKHPQQEFSIIIGSDSFQNLPRWKNFDLLIRDYEFIVYQRSGYEIKDRFDAKINILHAPLLDISATVIRQNIKEGKSIRYLVPDKAREEIEMYGYYK
jgi:nicotinate-nucleotide adenylyltransferase